RAVPGVREGDDPLRAIRDDLHEPAMVLVERLADHDAVDRPRGERGAREEDQECGGERMTVAHGTTLSAESDGRATSIGHMVHPKWPCPPAAGGNPAPPGFRVGPRRPPALR